MRNLLILCGLLLMFTSCSDDPKSTNTATTEGSKTSKKTVPADKKDFEKPKQIHPCDLIDLNDMAEMLNLDVNQMSARRERKNNPVCIVSTTEFAKGGKEQDIFFFNLLINSNGQQNYEQGIASMLSAGSMEIPAGPDKGKFMPLKEVNDLGGKGFVYSAAHYSALIFQKNNQYQYTMTLYKDVADSDIFNGLNANSQQLESWLIELARSM